LQARGLSQRQAANRLDVPRTTLQAWHAWQDRLDACPQVVAFFESVPGLAFLHRLVLALHVVFVEVGACGIRLVCLLLQLTGLDRFVGASYGTQQQVNRHVEEAIVAYNREETSHLAQEMPPKEITATQDETFTGGLCLVAIEPVSNYILLEHTAEARDHDTWQALMQPALAGLNCRVIQATSDEAPGLLAYVEHHLGAHHSPDLFHVQHELSKAVSVPLATKQRAAAKAVTKAEETLKQAHEYLAMATNAPVQRGPGRPPKGVTNLEQVKDALEGARDAHQHLSAQREQVTQCIRALGHAYHFVDLERGVRRNGKLIAGDIHAQLQTIRTIAQQADLSQVCLKRIEKAARVMPKMQATIEFVSGYVRQQVSQLALSQPASYAMHAHLIPSYYLERVAATRTVTAGAPLRALAERLRTEGKGFFAEGPTGLLGPNATDEVRAFVRAMIADQPADAIAAASLGMAERPDSNPDLPGIDVPTMVITGSDDSLIPPAVTSEMAERIPGAREFVPVENASHFLQEDRGEELANVVVDFVQRT
jgi:pimeloyl-ACP methyl ester carboxylesterase